MIPLLIKTMDISNDRELLLKLPVSSRQIFVSKIVVTYMFELVFAAVILFPILIAFGLASSMAVGFFFLIPVLLLFVPVLPFFLAILVMFPVMSVVRFLRNRSLLTIGLYLIGLVVLIVGYMYLVSGLVYAIADNGFANLLQDEARAKSIKNIAKFLYPAKAFANLFDTSVVTAGISFAIILAVTAAMTTIAFFVAGAKYKKIYMNETSMITKGARKSLFARRPADLAVIDKDIKNIFRSSNYTFQFLLVVVITPLLVYFCNRVAGFSVYRALFRVSEQDKSNNMIFGVSILVTLILIPLASAFAASNISREGYNIYHTKLVPVSFRRQLAIKALIVFVPIFVSITVSSCMTMLSYKMSTQNYTLPGLPFGEAFIVFIISIFMAIGYICMGTYIDLRKPLCNQVGAGELTKTTAHTNLVMIVGVSVGMLFGFLSMWAAFAPFFGSSFSLANWKIIMLVLSVVFAAVFAGLLFLDGARRYYRLEQ